MATAVKARPSRTTVTVVEPVRKWFGLSQAQFAQILRVSRATVVRWEEAKAGPEVTSAAGRVLDILVETQRLAKKVFRQPARAHQWLDTEIPALHGTPKDTLIRRGPLPVRDVLRSDLDGAYL